MKSYTMHGLAAALLVCVAPQVVRAEPNCFPVRGSESLNGAMALQVGTLAVPRDLPDGAMLYGQYFMQAGVGVTVQCNVQKTSMTPLFRLQGVGAKVGTSVASNFAGKVYATGVPGIGVAWSGGLSGLTWLAAGLSKGDVLLRGCDSLPGFSGAPSNCRSRPIMSSPKSLVILVKTGPVGTGVISASSLGRLSSSVSFGDSATEINIGFVELTGSISVVNTTCSTPDVSVPLGSHRVSSLVGGAATSTPTVSFVLGLKDCPGFPGNISVTGSTAPVLAEQNYVVRDPTFLPNSVRVRIDPASPAIDTLNGVLSLTAANGAAKGVGVQLLDSRGKPWPLSKEVKLDNVLGAGTRSLDITLGARYLKTTAGKVEAGPANALATYTLIYQ